MSLAAQDVASKVQADPDQDPVTYTIILNDPTLPAGTKASQVNDLLIAAGYDGVVTADDVNVYLSKRYAEYFLNSRSSVVQLELIEISHPGFTQTYRAVRNAVKGVTVTLETGGTAFFEYYPMKIVPQSARSDLDHSISLTFGDLGEILPLEMDAVMKYPAGLDIKPTVKYRVYRSDDLSSPLYGPLVLEVEAFTFNRQGSTFEAKAPSVNLTRTGEIYSLTRFPALRGFL